MQTKGSLYEEVLRKAKKLVALLETSMSMTGKKTEEEELKRVPCIWYPVISKDQNKALLDSGSEINTINPVFASQFDLKIWKTNVGAQKIDGTILDPYGIVVSIFSMLDKNGKERYFEESFLFAEVKSEIVFAILFLMLSSIFKL